MLRILRATALIAAVGFAAAIVPVRGHAADLNSVMSAAGQLMALGKNSYKTGQPPRASDPKVAALFDASLDIRDLALSPPLPPDQMGSLAKRLTAPQAILLIYTYAGTGYSGLEGANAAPDQATLHNQIAQNIVTYAPEVGRIYDAQVVISGAMIECFGSELWAHPERYQDRGWRQLTAGVRANSVTLVSALLGTLTIKGLSDTWRRERVVALVAIAPYVARFLLPEQRKLLHDATLDMAKQMTDPILQAGLKGLADLLIS